MASPAAPTAANDSATATDSSGGTSLTINRPTNVVEDDLMVAIIERAAATSAVTAPSGWTEEETQDHDGGSSKVYYKVAGGSEPSSYAWSWSGSTKSCGAIQRVTGADTTTPIADSPTPATGDSTSPDPPDSSGLSSDDYLAVCLIGQERASGTFTVSSGYTENVDGIGTSGGPPGANCSGYIESRQFTGTAESPGAATASNDDGWAAFTLIIAPAAAGDTTVTPATIATTTTVPGPTAQAGANVTPAEVATTSALDTPTITSPVTVSPDEIATTTAIDGPQPQAGANVTPSEVATSSALDTPTIDAGSQTTVTPSEVATTTALPGPTISIAGSTTPGVIVTTVSLPTPTPAGAATQTPATIVTLTTLPTPADVGGDTAVNPDVIATVAQVLAVILNIPEVDVTAKTFYRLARISGQLVLVPVGRSAHYGFKTSEGYEFVSDTIRMDSDPTGLAHPSRAMTVLAPVWAAHSGSSAATLKSAIHTALQGAGFRGQGGVDLT